MKIDMPSFIEDAIKKGDLDALKKWIAEDNARLRARTSHEETLLHKASYFGRVHIIHYLLDAGIDIEAKDRSGYRPLHEAARAGQEEAIRLLILRGADLDARLSTQNKSPRDVYEKQDKSIISMLTHGVEHWCLTGKENEAVIHRYFDETIEYSLTEIFNFKKEICTVIGHNLKTNNEAITLKSFNELGGTRFLEEAEREFKKLGGVLPGHDRLIKPSKGLSGL